MKLCLSDIYVVWHKILKGSYSEIENLQDFASCLRISYFTLKYFVYPISAKASFNPLYSRNPKPEYLCKQWIPRWNAAFHQGLCTVCKGKTYH